MQNLHPHMVAELTSPPPAAVNESVNARPADPEGIASRLRRRRGGAPPANLNGLRHGLYCARSAQLLSEYGGKQCALFRRKLEEIVLEMHGEIPIYCAALIQSAVEATRLAVANRELAAAASPGAIKLETRLALDREYAQHLDRRDRKLKELGLDPRDLSSGDRPRHDFPPLPDLSVEAAAAAAPSPLPAGNPPAAAVVIDHPVIDHPAMPPIPVPAEPVQ